MSLYAYKQKWHKEFFIQMCIVFERHHTERLNAHSNDGCCTKHFGPLSLKWLLENFCKVTKGSPSHYHYLPRSPLPSPPSSSLCFPLIPGSGAVAGEDPLREGALPVCRGRAKQAVPSSGPSRCCGKCSQLMLGWTGLTQAGNPKLPSWLLTNMQCDLR